MNGMKKSIWILCALVISQTVPAQQLPRQNQDFYNYLDKKSRNQKTTANILMISGGALTATGLLIGLANAAPDGNEAALGAAGTAIGIGFLSMVTSFPFYLSSASNRRKANELQVGAGLEKLDYRPGYPKQPVYYAAMRIHIRIP